MKRLENKVAIITGASSGIGKETAVLFAKEGSKVTVSDIDAENGNKVVEEIKKNGGEAIFVKADVDKLELDKWQKVIDVNLTSTFPLQQVCCAAI